jgi:hypothetical protein
MRDRGTYYVVREAHKVETDQQVGYPSSSQKLELTNRSKKLLNDLYPSSKVKSPERPGSSRLRNYSRLRRLFRLHLRRIPMSSKYNSRSGSTIESIASL